MENKENNSPELKKKSHWNIRPYLAIALTAFLVITLSIISVSYTHLTLPTIA